MWQEFLDLFEGYDRYYGQFEVKYRNEKGKQEGKAKTIEGYPDELVVTNHLEGKDVGLGLIPLKADDTCSFAAIDVDDYKISIETIAARIEKQKLPLIPCQSKSGGTHLYVFMDPSIPASQVRSTLENWAARLSLGGSEIFPKQSYRASFQDIGNWINLPYFGDTRKAFVKGKFLSLKDFLKYAKSKTVSKLTEDLTELPNDGGLFEEGPPCLKFLGC